MKLKNKKILIIIATHGDEPIGISVVKNLKKIKLDKYFDCLVANPRALNKNMRFINFDLNRSYPGKKKSLLYEEKKAYKNFKIIKQYQYVIDIHEASQGINNFIIVSRKKISNFFPINFINLNKVLLWPSSNNLNGSIGSVLKNAIGLEFGVKNKNRSMVITKASKIIQEFIDIIYFNKISQNPRKKKIFYVYGKLMKNEFKNKADKLTDFNKIIFNNEEFYPLLVNQYLTKGILCYKMKLIEK